MQPIVDPPRDAAHSLFRSGQEGGGVTKTVRDPRRKTERRRVLERKPAECVVLRIEDDLYGGRRFGEVEGNLLAQRLDPPERKAEPCLLEELARCGGVRVLARLSRPRRRRPPPVPGEPRAEVGAMEDEELASVRAFAPDDHARRERGLARNREAVPGGLHGRYEVNVSR
jgi:hypothetical protein